MWWLQCICIHWLPPCSIFELSSLSCHAGNLYQDPAMLTTPHYKAYADTMHMRSLTPSMLLIRTLLLPCGELDCDPAISITPHSKALDGGGVYNFLCMCVHVHLSLCVCVCVCDCVYALIVPYQLELCLSHRRTTKQKDRSKNSTSHLLKFHLPTPTVHSHVQSLKYVIILFCVYAYYCHRLYVSWFW